MAVLESWFIKYLFLTGFILPILIVIKYYYSKRKLFLLGAKLPGPKPWPIIGNALDFLEKDLDILAKLRKYHESYKSGLYALWLGHGLHVFVNSPELAEIYCQSAKLLDRSEKCNLIKPMAPNGLLFSNGAVWRKAKKITESALPYSSLKYYIPTFQKEGDILIQRLECEVGKPCFSIVSYLKSCAYDIISEVTVERERKAQRSELPSIEDVDLFTQLSNKRLYNIWHQWDFIYKFFPEGKEFFRIIDRLKDEANEEIIDRKKRYEEEKKLKCEENPSKTKRKIFWQELFDNESLSLDDIRDHLFSLVAAGYETSANSISFVLVMLALHRNVQEKVYQEVSSVVDGDFDEEKTRNLEYLEMVIKETLRLFPSVPVTLRQATDDCQIGEYLIPVKADVSLNIYELHRDPKQYDDPHKFNPDNFLPENVAKRHPYSFIPFSNGLRKCIGGKFAMYVIKVLVSMIVMSYKIECDYKSMDDIKVRNDISLTMPDGFQVRILKRRRYLRACTLD